MGGTKFSVADAGPLIKRVPSSIDRRHDISSYGLDNLYPQRIMEIMFRSSVTMSAVRAKADFVNGEGLSINGEEFVNEEKQLTANELLRQTSLSLSTFEGFAWHLNVNLLGEITEVKPANFEYARFGVPNEFGHHSNIKININWERDPQKLPQGITEMIFEFPIWPKNKDKALAFINEWIDDNPQLNFEDDFQGFIHYWTPVKDEYPKCSFDSVLDSAQTNGEIQTFELGNIQNGFLGATLFKHEGIIESDDERRKTMAKLAEMKGAGNANSILLVETPDGFQGDILENFPANNNDTLFNLTNQNVIDRIVQAFAQPPSILGIMPDSGIFNKQELEDSYIFYNLRTRRERMVMEASFRMIGENMVVPTLFGPIIEQSFTVGAINEEDQEVKKEIETEPIPE